MSFIVKVLGIIFMLGLCLIPCKVLALAILFLVPVQGVTVNSLAIAIFVILIIYMSIKWR